MHYEYRSKGRKKKVRVEVQGEVFETKEWQGLDFFAERQRRLSLYRPTLTGVQSRPMGTRPVSKISNSVS